MRSFLLAHKDSNLERLHQKQLCYHYTMGQFHNGCKFKTYFFLNKHDFTFSENIFFSKSLSKKTFSLCQLIKHGYAAI